MKAEVISIGTELLLGQIVDTNSQWLAEHLPALGIDLYYISQVGDNLERLTDELRRAWKRSDLLVTTGGLGPTEDDLTREAIANLLDEVPRVDPELEVRLRAWFAGRDIAMPERNLKQAWLLPSTSELPNPNGTAPGWFTERDGRIIVSMPGVPREMMRMWQDEVVPRLKPSLGNVVIETRILKTIGVGEASVEEMVDECIRSINPTLATYAKSDGVHLRLTAKADTPRQAGDLLDALEAKIRPIFGASIYGGEGDSLESVIGRILTEQGRSLATMESCTGGLIASAITDVVGASNYFLGGAVTYSADAKIRHGVPAQTIEDHGVVSPETAEAMAVAARREFDADYGLATTGVAGPEMFENVAAGTVYCAVASDAGADVLKVFWPRRARPEVKHWATLQALNLLRRRLLAPEAADVSSVR